MAETRKRGNYVFLNNRLRLSSFGANVCRVYLEFNSFTRSLLAAFVNEISINGQAWIPWISS